MSETEVTRTEGGAAPVAPTAETAPLTFGRRLAAERERQGLSVDEVASRLRLHPRQVRSIENEALPGLPVPFLRGFVRNYAKELRLDPEPLVAELSARLGPRPENPARGDAGAGGSARLNASALVSRPLVVGGAVAALIVLAILGWMSTRSDRRTESPPTPAVKTPGPTSANQPAAASDAAKDAAPQTVPTAVPAQAPADLASASVAPAAVPASTTAAPVSTASATSAPAFDGLRISFREQSWVEVTQGDGRVLLSQINPAGSEQKIDGKAPLRVVVGNASAVSIDFKGKSIDLKPVTNTDNVARITLN